MNNFIDFDFFELSNEEEINSPWGYLWGYQHRMGLNFPCDVLTPLHIMVVIFKCIYFRIIIDELSTCWCNLNDPGRHRKLGGLGVAFLTSLHPGSVE